MYQLELTIHEWADLNNVLKLSFKNHDKSTAVATCWLYMIELTYFHGNDEITRLNSDVTTTMNLAVVLSRILHVLTYTNNTSRFAMLYTICWNMIEQYYYFINHVMHVMLIVLLEGSWTNNPAIIACDIFARVVYITYNFYAMWMQIVIQFKKVQTYLQDIHKILVS